MRASSPSIKWTRDERRPVRRQPYGPAARRRRRGARRALEALLPADLAILKDAKPKYSLLLNDEGGIIDDLMVTRRGDHFYLVVNGATKEGDIAHLEARLPRGVVLDHMKEQACSRCRGRRRSTRWRGSCPGSRR